MSCPELLVKRPRRVVSTSPHHHGFTLLEVMLAVAIFSIIGTASYAVLGNMINAKQRGVAEANRAIEIQVMMNTLSLDFGQIISRSIRDDSGKYAAPLVSDSREYAVELTRAGWRNPLLLPRSELRRVAYALEKSAQTTEQGAAPHSSSISSGAQLDLVRYIWPVLDQSGRSKPVAQVLLRDVKNLKFRYLDNKGKWQDDWPPKHTNPALPPILIPLQVEVSFELSGEGEVTLVYPTGTLIKEKRI